MEGLTGQTSNSVSSLIEKRERGEVYRRDRDERSDVARLQQDYALYDR